MNAAKKQDLIQQYLDAYNAFAVDGMMKAIHEDIVFEHVGDGEVSTNAAGAKAFRELAEQSLKLFTSREMKATKFKLEGDGATATIEFTAVLAEDLENGVPAGETIEMTGRSEFEFRSNLIWRIRDFS